MDLLEEVVHVRTIGVIRNVTKVRRMDIARKARTSEQIARELAGFVQAKIVLFQLRQNPIFHLQKVHFTFLFIII